MRRSACLSPCYDKRQTGRRSVNLPATEEKMKTSTRMTAVVALALFGNFAAMAADPAKTDPIKIGVVNEITGVQAQAGEFTINGIRLAQEEINNAGGVLGRRIELQIEDNQST